MPTEKEKMLAGELYDPMDPELREARQRGHELTRAFNDAPVDAQERREELLRELLGSAGEELWIEQPFRCDYGFNVHVGESFYANFDCVFLDVCPIEIGEECMLGPSVHVYTATHPLGAAERTAGREYGKPVTIGDQVWIGGQAVINPGVTIGDRAVVASGAVVTEDVQSDVVVQGNPAEVVKEID